MNKLIKKSFAMTMVLILCLANLGITAFAADDDLIKLILSKNETTLQIGESVTLTATGVYEDNSTENLTLYADWTSENASVASVYNGTITAKAEGTTTIVASYDGIPQSVAVTVTKKVKALTKDKQSINIRKDKIADITLTATYSDNSTAKVSDAADWSSDNESVATVVNGTVTGLKSGTAVITGTYGSKSVSVDVSVDVAKRVEATKTQVSLLLGGKETVKLTATFADGTTEDVTTATEWSSSNEQVADVINGAITGYSAGTATITASYGTKSTTIAVDVDATAKLDANKEYIFLKLNGSEQLTLTATYPDGSTSPVKDSATWTTSDSSIAYVSKGLITGVKSGTATITAKYSDKTVQVVVDVEVARHLDTTTEEISLSVGQSGSAILSATYANGTIEDVTSKATWSSSNESVAYATKGTITSYKVGTATITGTYGGQSVTIAVSVGIPKKLTTTTKEITLKSDGEYQADLFAVYADDVVTDVSDSAVWTSNNTSIATVSKGLIKAVATGSTTITATYGEQTVTFEVGVEVVRRIEATKTQVSLLLKGTETVVLNATYSDGSIKDVASLATWSSSNENVADVVKGKITGYTAGTATITAAYGSKTTTIVVDVDQTTKLDIDYESVFLRLNGTKQLVLTATYPDGTTTNVANSATWTSSSDTIAQVSKGLITGNKSGTATITAVYSNKTVTITVDVEVARHLDISSDTLEMLADATKSVTVSATFANGVTEEVTSSATWSSDKEDIAYADKGVITAYSVGTAVITAAYGGKTATVTVSVGTPSKLKTTSTEVNLKVDGEYQADLFAVYADASEEDISKDAEWTTSDAKIATVAKGLITGVASGTATVTATYNGKTVKITVKVDVTDDLESNVRLVTMAVSDTEQIKLTATDAAGTTTDVTSLATWKSSKTAVADVKKGLITGYSKGKATITATYGDKSVTISVEVDQVSRIEASATNLSLKSGATSTVKVTVYYSDGKSKDVTSLAEWKTSSYKVATVSYGKITAVAAGKTNITANYAGKTIKIPVEVDTLKYLETSLVVLTMKVGQQVTLSATATYNDSSEDDVTKAALWTSSKSLVATVKNGVIKANSKGKATITVAYGDKKVKVVVTVVP